MNLVHYYSKRAAEYEAIYQKPERQQDLKRLKRYLKEVFSGKSVLELACGAGYWTQQIAKTCKSIVAVDASKEVLAIASDKTYQNVSPQFMQGDVYDLGQVEGLFDAGLAAFWWSHVPKRKRHAFLDHFHQQLQPGAIVCFVDNQYVAGSSTPISRTDAEGNTFQMRRLADGTTYEVMKNFPSENEWRELLDGTVKDISYRSFHYFWTCVYHI